MSRLTVSLPRVPLVPFDTRVLPSRPCDIVIIGSGSAALMAAIEASRTLSSKFRLLIVTKKKRSESNSYYAQGGIAAPLADHDAPRFHVQDTLGAGWGLSSEKIVKMVIQEGTACVRDLMAWGTQFDRQGRKLSFSREGGHGLARVIHRGDETGMELELSLLRMVDQCRSAEVLEDSFVVDLLIKRNVCHGVLIYSSQRGFECVLSRAVILASGGIGQVYRETTNPSVATGDGMAMAYRAGAVLQDMEFVQFHPTTLYLAGASRALVTEAVRGAGGVLKDKHGKTFMKEYHEKGDLAPRDVVSRSILDRMARTDDTQVYLDLRPIASRVRKHFPGLWNLCRRFGLDVSRDVIPVRPSAHYMIGGVRADEWGRTSVKGLYACGEAASTEFHGANRLASNSLLECLVFGRRAGGHAARTLKACPKTFHLRSGPHARYEEEIDIQDMRESIRSVMWRNAGIVRDEAGLKEALRKLLFWSRYVLRTTFHDPDGWELQNMLTVAVLITRSALERRESRGVHYRSDCPEMDDRRWKKHIMI